MTSKFSKFVQLHLMIGISLLFTCLTGCPDRSYQAPIPDYSNMTDGGEEYDQDPE